MSLTPAQRAVSDHLVAERGRVTWRGQPGPGGWVASTLEPGGAGAAPETVRFRRSKAFPGCELHWVDFVNGDGRLVSTLVRTRQGPTGAWLADPIGGGGRPPYRSRPWVNFAAMWTDEMFAAGGQVIGAGADQARLVRLTFTDGAVLADTVEAGIVLFYASSGMSFPATVDILGGDEELLASYRDFDYLDLA